LPAEITHLYEEVQAKDSQIAECRSAIVIRDNSLQKFIKMNGALVQNPKEEAHSKVISENFERAQILQEEKIGLVEKAMMLVSLSPHPARPAWLTRRWCRWIVTSSA
jgi:inhibitor of growth protein 3